MPQLRPNKLSYYVCILCMTVMAYASFVFYPKWNKGGGEATISWDVSGYYWYLPSVFIYKDLKGQSFRDSVFSKYHPASDFQQGYQLPNGNFVMKYSSGMALMYLPFFTAGHLVAGALGYPRDGFSAPYQLAIQIGGFLVAMLGIWYFRKLLLKFYSDRVVAISLAIVVLGTNYLNYSVIDTGMSHNWLFTIYVFLLLNTISFHATYKLKYAIRVGLLVGLATLTRPTEAISCLLPLLWGMEGIGPAAIKQQLTLLLRRFPLLLAAAACAAGVLSIQFIYWKYVSGHWVVYSYGDQKLDFLHSSLRPYAFSYRSGWLRYCPMMLLPFIGLIPFFMKGRNKVAITTFFLLYFYLVCAWSIWWYGGRAMVQSYPVLMFPVASLVQAGIDRKWLGWMLWPVIVLFAYLNIWVVYMYHAGGLYDTDTMTNAYYWRVIGRWSAPPATAALKDGPDLFEGIPANEKLVWEDDFENDSNAHTIIPPITGSRSLELNRRSEGIQEFNTPYKGGPVQWLRFQADFRCTQREDDVWKMTQFIARIYKGGEMKKQTMLRVYRFLNDHETRTIPLYMNVKGIAFDSIGVAVWNANSERRILIDNMKVYSFDKK